MPLTYTVPTALTVSGILTASNGTISSSVMSVAGQNLSLGVGSGGTAITITTSTLAVALAGNLTINSSASSDTSLRIFRGNLTDYGARITAVYSTGNVYFDCMGDSANTAIYFRLRGDNVSPTTAMLLSSTGTAVSGNFTVGNASSLTLANGARSLTAWGGTGPQLNVEGSVYTDTSSSGTVASAVLSNFSASVLIASNPTTYTNAATVYIAGGPTASTNVTIGSSWSLWTSGPIKSDGDITVTGGYISSFTGAAPITLEPANARTTIKGYAGGWQTWYGFKGTANTFFGGFGAYGNNDVLDRYFIGAAYNSNYAYFDSTGAIINGAIRLIASAGWIATDETQSLNIQDSSNANRRMYFGLNNTVGNGYAMIGAVLGGTDYIPLILQPNGGKVLIGTAINSGDGVLQLASHSTYAGGIGFGTETPLYRVAAGALCLDYIGGGSCSFYFRENQSTKAVIETVGGVFSVGTTTAQNITLKTNSVTGLTIDSSQHSIFAATARTGEYYVSGLPAGTRGMRAFVIDATATTFGSTVVGGGGNKVPVFYDGTNWCIG